MQFPIFQMPYLGNGMLIGLVAVIHVLIGHGVAVGAIAMVALAEYQSYRTSSAEWDRMAHGLLQLSIWLIAGLGSLLGVGIWFTIATTEARGTAGMLRVFFAPWFAEWIAFVAEVIILLIYDHTWLRWTAGRDKLRHVWLGFSYTGVAVVSLFLITGILGFMLTPDYWPWDHNFWLAFFNVTFLPQSFVRLGGSLLLGAVIALGYAIFSRPGQALLGAPLRLFGRVLLAALGVSALAAWWYFFVVPPRFRAHVIFAIITSKLSQQPWLFWIANGLGVAVLLLLVLAALKASRAGVRVLSVVGILCCAAFFTEFERAREFIRGPYIMPGYLYTNQILLAESPLYQEQGLLANSYWYNATLDTPSIERQGAYAYGRNCSACHTIGGLNNIAAKVQGRTEDGIYVILGHTSEMVPFMPPFSGTDDERHAVASYLYQIATGQLQVGSPSRYLLGR
jgi:hypothetical protein